MFNYNKVIVIGCPGAGKSTFSRKLHIATEIDLYHLDSIYWNGDCTHISREELIQKQKEILKKNRYIIDGNFKSTLELRIKEADVVFLFDLPTEICIEGARKRKGNRPEMPCQLPFNDELLDFIKNFNRDVMPKIQLLIEKYNNNVIVFRSHKEADDYLKYISTEHWDAYDRNMKLIPRKMTVTVKIDRPLGSYHPKHKDLYYPINYGYVEGIIAGDGEEQDAYVLGVNNPIKTFTGKLIAVIHRINDNETKWVVAKENMDYTVQEIEKQVEFQEQYFDYYIELV